MNALKSYLPRRSNSVSSFMRCTNQWTSSPRRDLNKSLRVCIPLGSMRCHFSSGGGNSSEPIDPIIDVASFQNSLSKYADEISSSLTSKGFYSTPDDTYSILPKHIIETMRCQSINLRDNSRFEQSWSERIDAATGTVTRFDKEGVFACEPDGRDYHSAPDLIMYMSVLLQTLPELLNGTEENYGLSVSSFNAKLAVTSPGGSVYPIHIDNPQGIAANDTRKLTCIIYLNPDYCDGDGGELRIYHKSNTSMNKDSEEPSSDKKYTDFKPDGGRMVLFWSDVIPHEVLATSPNSSINDASKDRYALTLWIPTANIETIHDPRSKFATLGNEVF
mmetsp:Transcript_6577/g.9414  ORF Transcript_6577/g.9414 Transcript_6577/m.9414 type:complete len:332 (-) Transcript_6577:60-1055(-)